MIIMTQIKIFQIKIRPMSSVFIISWLLFKIGAGQDEDWPIVTDPFPDELEIGTEPPPTPPPTPDCSLACQEKVDEAMGIIRTLQDQLIETNKTLLDRIIILDSNNAALTSRIQELESHLQGNATTLSNKINTDVGLVQSQLSRDLAALKSELEAKISRIPSGGGGGQVMDVYLNLTQRINGLESGKIQHLIVDNNLWRQNFRVVNATFAKLKKSASTNKVIITG